MTSSMKNKSSFSKQNKDGLRNRNIENLKIQIPFNKDTKNDIKP